MRSVLEEQLEALAQDLAGIPSERSAPMSARTTFGIGGPADLLVMPRDREEVVRVLAAVRDRELPLFFLGGGSNLLVGDGGIRGVVVQLAGELTRIEVREGGRAIACGAGATFPRLTRTALNEGWRPAMGWMGTPGQVGGALKMNAGTRDGEIGDTVVFVEAASADGAITLSREDCGFAYRKSKFSDSIVLTSVLLQCDSRESEQEKRVELDAMAKELLKRRHRTQPKLRSAGSIFKNPAGDYAGRLIEAAGLKGLREGNAQISDVHANFVVNLGKATAKDVVALAERAQLEVKERFGVALEWEVRRVGEFI